ncbi:MAG: hypothetical protein U9N78_06885 [Actinomycetota bacterium]|nr:hypothetical protein [Actinomycetota bacterium]
MDELIAQIMEKTGVTADKAREMIGVTTEWMKDKLPESLADQVSTALAGAGDMASSAVDKSKDAAGSAAGVATGAATTATETAGGLWDKAKDTVTGLTSSKDE